MNDVLAPIVSRLAREPDRPGVRAAFARAILRRVPEADLEHADPAVVAAAIADAFELVDDLGPGEIHVRLTDADVALDGASPAGTLMEVSCEDRQFIVTTVREELRRLGQPVVRMLHPVYGAERATGGPLTGIVPARTAPHRESFLQVELGARVPEENRAALVAAICGVLRDVFAATEDYAAMRSAVADVIQATWEQALGRYAEDEVVETAALLEWVLDGNFVVLGCCRFDPNLRGALGILARSGGDLIRPPTRRDPPLLRIVRSRQVSTVHRQVAMHCVDVTEVSPDGRAEGTFRIVGVFSYKGNAEPATSTPVLRFKLRRVLELEDVVEGSQDESTLVSLFQVLPKDELFEVDVPALREMLARLLAAEHQHDVRVSLRLDEQAGTVSALLSVPQELYSPAIRQRIERFLLAQLDGSRVDTQVSLGDRTDVIVRLVVSVDGPPPRAPLDDLEREVRLLTRTWDQQLLAALSSRVGESRGSRLAQQWARWFPPVYRDAVMPEHAVDDVLQLDLLAAAPAETYASARPIRIVLAADPSGLAHARLKVFVAGPPLELSAFHPILESLGLWAIEELPYTLGSGERVVHLHDFGVTDPVAGHLDVEGDGSRLSEAAVALWHGRAETDALNRLVLRGGASWDDVAVLRAYRRYRTQVGTAFTTGYVDDVLVGNAGVACDLLRLFAARFDPSRPDDAAEAGDLHSRVEQGCDAVPRLDHDRILRGFLALVDATVRTNRYLGPPGHIALKLDSAAVPDIPRPVPYREIFVHGPTVEGVHLRWGPVSRGGIRWSERPDDYRNEVLDLMRAQVLKNAVIVPTGAKGGFIVKARIVEGTRSGDSGPTSADVRRAYELFITSLLQVTDNLAGGGVVAVPRRRDGDDPYLVVAADRGTAGFSDDANRIAERRGFWLGDAFASGGSRGYNHKRLGITARGAWTAVRHHFAELGIDVDAESVSVVGIGDMSGDVFGNGMLCSDRIRLVAAFDHRDIFLDPNPDPELSFKERARLFALAASSWQDYDRALLSPGGGVFGRLDKRIDLSPEVRAALAVDAEHLTPAELIRAILEAPVALLFAGGIGTFVRASSEPDRTLDDRANADVRVEGSRVRARVVGEGANLAFTQRARIEYARRGGRINTDAIDNSGGVDTSDREVNIKILLGLATEAGELTTERRDQLLEEVCEDVVAAVLRDCADQSLALTLAQAASPGLMDAGEALLADLETTAVLDRSIEALPTGDEMRARAGAGAGLTRPELAVLLAGAKRSLDAALLASDVPEQAAMRDVLVSYFPPPLAKQFDALLDHHPLRRELVASVVANDVVNHMGPTFAHRLARETGSGQAAVAAAYWAARGVADAPSYWRQLDDDHRGLHGAARVEMADVLTSLIGTLARNYLRRDDIDIDVLVESDRPAFAVLEATIGRMGTAERRRLRSRRAEALVDLGADPVAAVRWACLTELDIVPEVADVARQSGRPVTGVADAFLRVGERLGIDRLLDRLARASVSDRWSRAAWHGLFDDLEDLRPLGVREALRRYPSGDEAAAVDQLLAAQEPRLRTALALVADVERDTDVATSLDALAVAARALRRVVDADC